MTRGFSFSTMALVGLCIIGVTLLYGRSNNPVSQRGGPELWRDSAVEGAAKAFYGTSSKTNLAGVAVDGDGQRIVLGTTHKGNGVPWFAHLTDDGLLDDPVLLSTDTIRVPRPGPVAATNTLLAFLENGNAGQKGGGIYSDLKLYDETANERARHYRFNFRTATTFHTRASVVLVDRLTQAQTRLHPFGDADARLISLTPTDTGFVAGGYAVPDGQFGTLPALVMVSAADADAASVIFADGFGPGSHWIDDISVIDPSTLLVVGASTITDGATIRDLDGWLARYDVESGTLLKLGEAFPAKGRSLLTYTGGSVVVATATQTLRLSLQGDVLWSVDHKKTLPGVTASTFTPRTILPDGSGGVWVAGSVATEDWVGWMARISDTGDIQFGFQSGLSRNAVRFTGLVADADGGVTAIGTLFCRFSNCGDPFTRGFLLRFSPNGQIAEAEYARFIDFAARRAELDFHNDAPKACTLLDRSVCDAVAALEAK